MSEKVIYERNLTYERRQRRGQNPVAPMIGILRDDIYVIYGAAVSGYWKYFSILVIDDRRAVAVSRNDRT